ncbi:MAG: hypothetical protein ABFD24_09465 [Anaerolineaceae bacterium]
MDQQIAVVQSILHECISGAITNALKRTLNDLKAKLSDLVDTKVMLESNYTRQRITLNFKISVLRQAIAIKEKQL